MRRKTIITAIAIAVATVPMSLMLARQSFAQSRPNDAYSPPPLSSEPQGYPDQAGKPTKPGKPAAKPSIPSAAAKPAPSSTEGAPRSDGSAQLRARIDQLEEQLVDMQTAVGTLESFAKSSASRTSVTGGVTASQAGAGGSVGDAGPRIEALEVQIRALTSQLEQLTQKIRTLDARLASGAGAPSARPLSPTGPQERGDVAPVGRQEGAVVASSSADVPRSGGGSFDGIGGLLKKNGDTTTGAAPVASAQPAAFGQPAGGVNPREAYDRAYGALLQQDYPSAEVGFSDFLAQFPTHELAGNAQYWLGESLFVRGQFREAANAYLKGYKTYAKSQKAPDSLLKLAISLDRLGLKDAACSSLSELNSKYASASPTIQGRAQSERTRLACP